MSLICVASSNPVHTTGVNSEIAWQHSQEATQPLLQHKQQDLQQPSQRRQWLYRGQVAVQLSPELALGLDRCNTSLSLSLRQQQRQKQLAL